MYASQARISSSESQRVSLTPPEYPIV